MFTNQELQFLAEVNNKVQGNGLEFAKIVISIHDKIEKELAKGDKTNR